MFIIFGLKSIIKQLLNLVYGFIHLKCISLGISNYDVTSTNNSWYAVIMT